MTKPTEETIAETEEAIVRLGAGDYHRAIKAIRNKALANLDDIVDVTVDCNPENRSIDYVSSTLMFRDLVDWCEAKMDTLYAYISEAKEV